GVLFPPGLEHLNDIALDSRIFQEQPSLINEERFEDLTDLWIADDSVRAMEDVKEQKLQHFQVLVDSLKIEALKAREHDGVLGVVEYEIELPAYRPLGEAVGETAVQRIRQNSKHSKARFDFVEILDLAIEIALLSGCQLQQRRALNQNLEK